MEKAPKGLSEDIIRFISGQERKSRNGCWNGVSTPIAAGSPCMEPDWARVSYPKIDFNDIYYSRRPEVERGAEVARRGPVRKFSRPTREVSAFRLREQEMLAGIAPGEPGTRSMRCSIPSPSPRPSKKELAEAGVIFCSISEAVREYPELVKKVSRHRRGPRATTTMPR